MDDGDELPMSVQLLEGLPLLVGGAVALHADCCCDDPCIECLPCKHCWSSDDDPCSDIVSVTATIAGVAAGTGSCSCTAINGAYVMSPRDDGCVQYSETIFTDCRINTFTRYTLNVDYALRFNQYDDYVINDIASLLTASTSQGLEATADSKLCNNYTLLKGHYVWLRVRENFNSIGSVFIQFNQVFLYCFGNATIKAGCPDDQTYGLCSLLESGGIMTKLFAQKWSTGAPTVTPACTYGDPAACDFSGISITIGAPDIDAETPPPPPP